MLIVGNHHLFADAESALAKKMPGLEKVQERREKKINPNKFANI